MQFVERKFQFPQLENWDSYGAFPTSEASLDIVRKFSIVPLNDGGIVFEIESADFRANVEFDGEGKFLGMYCERPV